MRINSRKRRLNFSKKRIWNFEPDLRIAKESSHGVSGLEKPLASGTIPQVALHENCRGDLQLIIDISIDVILKFFAIHSWSCCFRSAKMR